jgi:hypothetical protein
MIRRRGRGGHGYIVQLILMGALLGGVCAIPTLILASSKKLPLALYLWVQLGAGALASLCLAIPAGIGTFIHVMSQPPGKQS